MPLRIQTPPDRIGLMDIDGLNIPSPGHRNGSGKSRNPRILRDGRKGGFDGAMEKNIDRVTGVTPVTSVMPEPPVRSLVALKVVNSVGIQEILVAKKNTEKKRCRNMIYHGSPRFLQF